MSTETIIQNRFYYDFYDAFHVILPNVHIDWGSEMDLFCIRKSGYCEEFEIKLTAADFKADFKKTCTVETDEKYFGHTKYGDKLKHELLLDGKLTANRFNFIIPEELVEKIELPEYAGLYIFRKGRTEECFDRIFKKKQGKLLHKNKVTDAIYRTCCTKYHHRFWNLRNSDE